MVLLKRSIHLCDAKEKSIVYRNTNHNVLKESPNIFLSTLKTSVITWCFNASQNIIIDALYRVGTVLSSRIELPKKLWQPHFSSKNKSNQVQKIGWDHVRCDGGNKTGWYDESDLRVYFGLTPKWPEGARYQAKLGTRHINQEKCWNHKDHRRTMVANQRDNRGGRVAGMLRRWKSQRNGSRLQGLVAPREELYRIPRPMGHHWRRVHRKGTTTWFIF